MDCYIGTKIVQATAMTAVEFYAATWLTVRGATSDDQPGYRVVYEDGYASWSPKEVFERAYRRVTESEAAMIGARE